MTPDQFSALAELLHLRAGPAQEAARLVLVDGLRPSEAADKTGISRQSVSGALTRLRRGAALANAAAGCTGLVRDGRPHS